LVRAQSECLSDLSDVTTKGWLTLMNKTGHFLDRSLQFLPQRRENAKLLDTSLDINFSDAITAA
jgi:hypothetical protein